MLQKPRTWKKAYPDIPDYDPMTELVMVDVEAITHREGQVLDQLARGHTRQETADVLGIKLHTVKRHLEQARSKSGANTTTELVVAWVTRGCTYPQ